MMRAHPLAVCTLISIALSSSVARADAKTEAEEQEKAREENEAKEKRKLFAPLASDTTNSILPVPAVDARFEASEADKRLVGRIGFVLGRLAFETKVSAPISETGDPVTAVTLDGLEAGTSLEAALAYTHLSSKEDVAAAKAICLEAAQKEKARAAETIKAIKEVEKKIETFEAPAFACTVTSLPEAQQAEFKGKDAIGRDEMCIAHREKLKADEIKKLFTQLSELKAAAIDPDKPFVCARSSLSREYRARFDAAMEYGTPVVVGLRGKVDRKSYKFADETTLENKKEKLSGYSVGVFGGLLLRNDGALAAFVRRERLYEEGDKSTFCLPGSVAGSLMCNERALGAPEQKDRWVAAVSYQRTLEKRVGAVARVGVDFSNSTLLAELPIFFLSQAEKSFTGGIVFSASYAIDDKEFDGAASVFLGGRFDVLGVDTDWN